MFRSLRRLSAASTLLLAASCGADAVSSTPAVQGEYALELVNGTPLPFLKEQTTSQRVEVVSGSLLLRPDFTYSGTILEQWTNDAGVQSFPESSTGTFSVSGSQLTFTEAGSGAVYLGSFNATRITATLMDVTFRFIKE